MSQINPISETFQGTANSVYNLLYPGIINGPFNSNVLVNSVLQTAVTDYNIIANTLIFYTGKPDANIVVQHYTEDNATINLTNLIELSARTSSGTNANGFGVVNVAGQSDILADQANDRLIVVAGAGIILTTDSPNDTLTITATGGAATDQFARDTANAAWTQANTANITAQAAFNKANTANITGEAAFAQANTANITGDAAFAKANLANTLAQSAHDKANGAVQTGFVTINIANSPNIVATTNADTLIFQAGEAIAITGNSTLDRINISATYLRNSDWVLRTPALNIAYEQVTWADKLNLFVAVSSNNTAVSSNQRVMTSPDGITWTSRTAAEQVVYSGITYNGNVLVAVATSTFANQVMISTDAITWQSRPAAVTGIQWRDVTWNGNIFCAVAATGVANGVMISTDGTTWLTRVPAADLAWRSVVWAKELNLFVAVAASGTGNRVMTSPDGTTWTSQTSAADNNWIDLSWNGKLFVAIAFSGTNTRVMTSPDGINWTLRYTPVNNQWTAIQWTGTQFVVVSNTGTSDRIMTSPDGIVWTSRPSPQDCDWKGLAWNGQTLVAVGTAGNNNQVMTSTYDIIPQAGAGITFTANSRANTLTWSVDTSNIAFPDGNVTNPSITNIGDLNTGFWFPAEDTIGTSTGGVERMRVTSTGFVGIGTASPNNQLEIYSNSAFDYIALTNFSSDPGASPDAEVYTQVARGTPAAPAAVQQDDTLFVFGASAWNGSAFTSNKVWCHMVAAQDWTAANNGTYIDWATTANNSTVGTVRVRINPSGNVGIANTDPRHKLSVSGTSWFRDTVTLHNGLIADGTLGVAGSVLTSNGATPRWTGASANGQLLIGNTVSGGFDVNTLSNTGTGGILITNDKGSITLAANVIWVRGNLAAVTPLTYTASNGTFTHAGSGVTATGYGSASQIPVFVVNETGHVTSVTNTAIAGLAASVITTGQLAVARGGTGLSPTIANGAILIGNTVNSGFDLNTIANTGTGGILITNGQGTITLAANVIWMRGNISATAPINYTASTGVIAHDTSGVTATGYGTASQIPVFVVNATGHVTSVTNTAIAGLDAGVITTGQLAVARGGTGLSPTISNGALLIGNTVNSGFDLTTLSNTGTGGILITNGKGTITLAANVIWIRGNVGAVAPITYTASNGNFTHDGSGVTATGYGTANTIPTFVVNATGHVTSALNVESTMSATIHQQTMSRVSLGF